MDEDWCSHCLDIVKTKLYDEPDGAWWDCSLCGKILGDTSTRRTKEQLSKLRMEILRRTKLARNVQRLVQQSQREREVATQSAQSS
ncbi:hypothetical protein L6164_029151 [Bauhinia variegata]|uniref:Uncharacterized protein n=1 Tax=Bauhinia variegata TaxID=167791 RepID=A0ACB9L8B8_BAUVA|nr:hypothetical protein L6164_029151 [Bauhinia variegata]